MNEEKTVAETIYEKLQTSVIDLSCRWNDEKEYEDINDYGDVLKTKVEELDGTFVKMTKRPFGFTFTVDDAKYKIGCNATQYYYKRMK